MALDLTAERPVSGETETFPVKWRSQQIKLENYSLEREEKDAEVDEKAQQAAQAAEESAQNAQAAQTAKNSAQQAALTAGEHADRAETAAQAMDGAEQMVADAQQAATDVAQKATQLLNSNETAIENAQLMLEATATLQNAGEGVQANVDQAASQAANQAAAGITDQMAAYLEQAQQAAASSGKSAHEIWLSLPNNSGTEADFILSLKGAVGATGAAGATGATGQDGNDGKSTYQIWLDEGGQGDEAAFLLDIKGEAGSAGAAGSNGQNGVKGDDGADGKSAYQSWLDDGNTGSEADFITDLAYRSYQTTELVFYVDNSLSEDGDGKLASPFNDLEDAIAAAALCGMPTRISIAGGQPYILGEGRTSTKVQHACNVHIRFTKWKGDEPLIQVPHYKHNNGWAYVTWRWNFTGVNHVSYFDVSLEFLAVSPSAGYYPHHSAFVYGAYGSILHLHIGHASLTIPTGVTMITPYVTMGGIFLHLSYVSFTGGGTMVSTPYKPLIRLMIVSGSRATDSYYLSNEWVSLNNLVTNYTGAQLARISG